MLRCLSLTLKQTKRETWSKEDDAESSSFHQGMSWRKESLPDKFVNVVSSLPKWQTLDSWLHWPTSIFELDAADGPTPPSGSKPYMWTCACSSGVCASLFLSWTSMSLWVLCMTSYAEDCLFHSVNWHQVKAIWRETSISRNKDTKDINRIWSL